MARRLNGRWVQQKQGWVKVEMELISRRAGCCRIDCVNRYTMAFEASFRNVFIRLSCLPQVSDSLSLRFAPAASLRLAFLSEISRHQETFAFAAPASAVTGNSFDHLYSSRSRQYTSRESRWPQSSHFGSKPLKLKSYTTSSTSLTRYLMPSLRLRRESFLRLRIWKPACTSLMNWLICRGRA